MGLRFIGMLILSPLICGIGIIRPFLGLMLLIFMYYFRPDVYDAPDWFRPQLWYTAAVGLGWVLHLKNVKFPPLMMMALLVVALCYVTSPWAEENVKSAKDATAIVFKLVLVMLLTVNLVNTPKRMHWFLWTNIFGMIYNFKAILWSGLHGNEIGEDRVDVAVGQGGGANYIAMILTMSVPFLYMRVLNGDWNRWERWLALGLLPFYVLSVVLTGSRGGFLSLVAVAFYMLARSNKKAIGAIVVTLLLALFAVTMPEKSIERFKQGLGLEGQQRDKSAASRLRLWAAALTMFSEHPIKGVGLDNYQALSPRYAGVFAGKGDIPYQPGMIGRGFVTHSTWLQSLAEGGLLISVPFFGMFPMAFFLLARVKRIPLKGPIKRQLTEHAVVLEGVMLAFIVSSFFGSHFKIDFMWWYFGAVAALGIIAKKELAAAIARARAERLQAIPPAAPVKTAVVT